MMMTKKFKCAHDNTNTIRALLETSLNTAYFLQYFTQRLFFLQTSAFCKCVLQICMIIKELNLCKACYRISIRNNVTRICETFCFIFNA